MSIQTNLYKDGGSSNNSNNNNKYANILNDEHASVTDILNIPNPFVYATFDPELVSLFILNNSDISSLLQNLRYGDISFHDLLGALQKLFAQTAYTLTATSQLHRMSARNGLEAEHWYSMFFGKFRRHRGDDLDRAPYLNGSKWAKVPQFIEERRAEARFGLFVQNDEVWRSKERFYIKKLPDPRQFFSEDAEGNGEEEEEAIEEEKKTPPYAHSLYDWFIRMPRQAVKKMLRTYNGWSSLETGEMQPLVDWALPSDPRKYRAGLKAMASYIHRVACNAYMAVQDPSELLSYSETEVIRKYFREEALKPSSNFLIKDWIEIVDLATGTVEDIDERLLLAVKSCIIPPVAMDFAPHALIISNSGTGKSSQFEKVGTLFAYITRSSLRGYSTADKNMQRTSITNDRDEALIIDQVESLDDDTVLADLFYLMDKGTMTIGSAGDLITIHTGAPIILLGNPPETLDTRYSFYALLKKIAQPAIARRFSMVIFDTNMKHPALKGDANRVYALEKRLCRNIRMIADMAHMKLFALKHGLGYSPYCLQVWLTETNEHIRLYKETIENLKIKLIEETGLTKMQDMRSEIDKRIDGSLVSFLDSVKENGQRMKAMAVQCALVDLLPVIYAFDLSEPIELEKLEGFGDNITEHVIRIHKKIHALANEKAKAEAEAKKKQEKEKESRDGIVVVEETADDKTDDKKPVSSDTDIAPTSTPSSTTSASPTPSSSLSSTSSSNSNTSNTKVGTIRMYEALLAMIIHRAEHYYLPLIIKANLESITKIVNAYVDLRQSLAFRYYNDKDLADYKRDVLRTLISIVRGEAILPQGFNQNRFSMKKFVLVAKSKADNREIRRVSLSRSIQKILDRADRPTTQDFKSKLSALFDVEMEIIEGQDVIFVIKNPATLKTVSEQIVQSDDMIWTVETEIEGTTTTTSTLANSLLNANANTDNTNNTNVNNDNNDNNNNNTASSSSSSPSTTGAT
ncbi:MAG: hypothetical protein QXF17_01400 [Ignisphaera sp.]